MSGLLKYLLYALLIFIVGVWIFTVAKTCNSKDVTDVVENPISSDATDKATANLDDLYSDEDDSEGDGDNSAKGDSDLYDEDVDEDDVAAAKRAAMAEADEKGDELTRDLDEKDAAVNKSRNSSSSRNNASSGSSASSSQKYLVVAASYLSEANAKAELRKLKRAGYDEAEIVVFDFSQYHTLCVARYNNLGEANSVKRKLINSRYPDAYVHRKRARKR